MHRTYVAAYALALLAGAWTSHASAEDFGHFGDPPQVEWIAGGDDRNMQLLRPFQYFDGRGLVWLAPSNAIIDGASIPRQLWTLVGSPFTGKYRRASIVHDYYCDIRDRRWQDVHMMFYEAMRAGGVAERQAKTMYAAVYAFGPRWPDPDVQAEISTCIADACTTTPAQSVEMKNDISDRDFQNVLDSIEQSNPSIEQINRLIDQSSTQFVAVPDAVNDRLNSPAPPH